MLVRFRVENHRSIRDEQTLSMVAAEPLDDPRLITTPALEEKLLPAIALYGANGSGKSNVLHALDFMCAAVEASQRTWSPTEGVPRDPFALSPAGEAASTYEVDIVVADSRYTYGFSANSERIEREWLRAWPAGHDTLLFERDGDSFSFAADLGGPNETIQTLTRPNSLFLSAAGQNNHPRLGSVQEWFRSVAKGGRSQRSSISLLESIKRVDRWVADEAFYARLVHEHEPFRTDFLAFLKMADTGIDDVRATQSSGTRLRLELRHQAVDAARAWLAFDQESDGTKRIAWLTSAVLVARLSGVAYVDELEANLHPSVALEVLRAHNAAPERGQLLFTTHDALLLQPLVGEPPLRRDQIWFTEKDAEGATHLFPLSDFVAQEPENIARGYLQGRYGAVPFVGNLAELLARKA